MTTRLVLAVTALLLAAPAFAADEIASRPDFEASVRQVGEVQAVTTPPALYRRPAAPGRRGPRFLVAPYGWLAGNSGKVVTNGVETDLDFSFDDITKHVTGGFQLYTEARWRGWFIAFDGTWAKLGTDLDLTLATIDIDITQRIFDVRVGREIFRCSRDGALDPCCEPYRRWVVADAFIGARYWYTRTDVTYQGILGRVRQNTAKDERWDPFVGMRFGFDVTRRWGLGVRADVGGFGIGDAAQLSWQVAGFASYDVTRWLHLVLGWRALYSDTIEGTGTIRNGAALLQHGPIIGGGFTF